MAGMKRLLCGISLAALAAGCASYNGAGLVPGVSTGSDVEAVMGTPAEVREVPGRGTVLWYPRMPYGDGSYAALIGADGRLVSIEQRITEENIAHIVPGKSTADEVRDIVGPPYRIDQFPRLGREVWTYRIVLCLHYPRAHSSVRK